MKKRPAHHKAHASSTSLFRSDQMSAFYVHAIMYLMVILGLFVYLYSNSKDLTVLYWVVIGWGVGLVVHALAVFGLLEILHREF